jgi:hypothetical protein
MLHTWDVLDPIALKPQGTISEQFLQLSVPNYREAARYVGDLPYGRNSNTLDPLIVLKERRGTCSTKHVLLRRLAIEQKIDVVLVVGIYEMNARNTPGIGQVLEQHNVISLPEAHCYLRSNGRRVDLTRGSDTIKSEPITRFLHEEEIEPNQAGIYKRELHQRFLRQWIEENGTLTKLTFEELWKVREQCIAALTHPR